MAQSTTNIGISPSTPELFSQPVADHIRTDCAELSPDWTVETALTKMRESPPNGRIIYFYVTDDDKKLLGVVPTRQLLLSPPHHKVTDIMVRNVVAIPSDATVLEACEFFTLHRFLAFPVIDRERKLLGVVDVELYTEELSELGHHDTPMVREEVFQLIGVYLSEAVAAKPWPAALGRFPWLLCNIAGGLMAAFLSGMYQDVLTWKSAVLALFIPIVLALSESVAIQSVTLTLSGLRATKASWAQLLSRGLAEGGVGLLLGIASAFTVSLVAGVWLQDFAVVGVIMVTIFLAVTASALIGFGVPTLLHILNKNPQVAAGPVSLASADLITLLLYFNLARLVMN